MDRLVMTNYFNSCNQKKIILIPKDNYNYNERNIII